MIKTGIATSVSALYGYSPADTITYLRQHSIFSSLQIFIPSDFQEKELLHPRISQTLNELSNTDIYIHIEGMLNHNLVSDTAYLQDIINATSQFSHKGYIIHFDQHTEIEDYEFLLQKLTDEGITPIWLEIYFTPDGNNYQLQLSKYHSIFSLYHRRFTLRPVIDIPRFYHAQNQITMEQATVDLLLTLNLMKELKLPILLHLIDVKTENQQRKDFCALGEGIIPYRNIFHYIQNNNIVITDTILEFEDKIKPLESLNFLSDWSFKQSL